MTKYKRRLLSGVLALAMSATLFSGCGASDSKQTQVKTQEKQNTKQKIADTKYDLVSGGKSTYTIMIPEKATENEKFAASELQLFFQEATGVKLEIVTENKQTSKGGFLSVGDTKASEKVGVKPTRDEVKSNGFVIRTLEENCYIKGPSDMGTRNGVYEWLSYCFDYECYSKDVIDITETKERKLPAFDIRCKPTFDFREAPGYMTWDDEAAYRMRFNPNAEIFVTGRACHTSYTLINPYKYDYTSAKYKNWYSAATFNNMNLHAVLPAQLCYSNAAWWDVYVKNLEALLEDSDAPVMIMGMEDYNSEWCECDACKASKEKYGTDAAVMIKFANYVQEKINQWYKKEHPEKTPVQLLIFAYRTCEKAPVTYNSKTNTYEPIDDSVKMHEDLGVYFAPVEASYAYPFTDKINETVTENLNAWSSLTDNICAWTYSLVCYNAYIIPDCIDVLQENYKLLADKGTISLLDQEEGGQKNCSSGWTGAKIYCMSKLMWDVNLNMEELLDDYFAHLYGDAADIMKNLYETDRMWMRHVYADLGSKGSIFEDMLKPEYWSYPMIQKQMDGIEDAYAVIEKYKDSDPETYQKYYNHINLESLAYRYLILSLYETEYDTNEIYEMKCKFKQDSERLGITVYGENKDVQQLWDSWGI